MNANDLAAINTLSILIAALYALLVSAGVAVPLWVPATLSIAGAIAIATVRAYIAVVGKDQTRADERLAAAERVIAIAREVFPVDEAPTKKEVPRARKR